MATLDLRVDSMNSITPCFAVAAPCKRPSGTVKFSRENTFPVKQHNYSDWLAAIVINMVSGLL